MDFIKINKEHTFKYKMENDKVILHMNNQLKNYFLNRGLSLSTQVDDKNYIYTYGELYKTGEYNKNAGKGTDIISNCLIHNIPVFNRNRLRYMEKNNIAHSENWYKNRKRYDKYALEHLSETLLTNGIRYILFTWNLDCLYYVKDNTLNSNNKNVPMLYEYNQTKKLWEEVSYG